MTILAQAFSCNVNFLSVDFEHVDQVAVVQA